MEKEIFQKIIKAQKFVEYLNKRFNGEVELKIKAWENQEEFTVDVDGYEYNSPSLVGALDELLDDSISIIEDLERTQYKYEVIDDYWAGIRGWR